MEIIGAICSLASYNVEAKSSPLSWILSIHISVYPNLSNSDKHNFTLKDISMYPNLSNSNKHSVALKDTENDEINGGKDSAILSKRDVKDNSLVRLNPLNQTKLGQLDDEILSKQPDHPTIFGASKDTKPGDTNTFSNETIKPPKVTISQLSFVGEDGYGSY